MQFRKDINGLRAVAVIAVMLFHFNPSWLPGGFIGVDIFFVISGFLMTAIITGGIERKDFSLLRFYRARMRRIVPALALLCLVLLVMGWFVLSPGDYRQLGLHAASSVSFISNFVYLGEAGYFDAQSHQKWLLHTWSLSVEWQFYLLYPLLLLLIRRVVAERNLKHVVLGLTICSFALCILVTWVAPSAAYFLIITRAWQMLLGAVAFLYPFRVRLGWQRTMALLGLGCILVSCFVFSAATLWPSYWAVIPVMGAFLVIQAHHNNVFTQHVIMQHIGKWSYSIYLWHWPVVVAIHFFVSPYEFVYWGLLLSVLLGFLSYRYIECASFRPLSAKPYFAMLSGPALLMLLVASLGYSLNASDGIKGWFTISAQTEKVLKALVMPYRDSGYCFYSHHKPGFTVSKQLGTNCYLGNTEQAPSTLLFGDSFAGHYEPLFDVIFKRHNVSLQSVTTNWCTPSLSQSFSGPKNNPAYQQCLINRAFLEQSLGNYNEIIFAGAWGTALEHAQLDEVKELVKKAASLGIKVVLVAAPVEYAQSPLKSFETAVYLNKPFDIKKVAISDDLMQRANTQLDALAKSYDNVLFISRKSLFDSSQMFEHKSINYPIPYSLDGRHISVLGAKAAADFFMQQKAYKQFSQYMGWK